MIHTAGNIFLAAAIVVSVLLWGYAMWWLLMGIASVLETFSQGIPFNLGWWGSGELEVSISAQKLGKKNLLTLLGSNS